MYDKLDLLHSISFVKPVKTRPNPRIVLETWTDLNPNRNLMSGFQSTKKTRPKIWVLGLKYPRNTSKPDP